MVVHKELFRLNGTNGATISAGATVADRFPSRLRVRMSELQENLYGAFNVFRFVNKSSVAIRVHFTWGISAEIYEDIPALGIRNIEVSDGLKAYGFDIENLDAAVDISANEIQYTAAVVEQIPEVLVNG